MSWYEEIQDDVLLAARTLAGNWRKFQSFGWSSDAKPKDAEQCAIVYLSNRDSDCLEKSNESEIVKALEPWTGWMKDEPPSDVETQSHAHWAVGHVDGIIIRCLTADGEVTEAFAILHKLAMRLQDYPALNEDDWMMRESEEGEGEEAREE